MSKMPTNVTQEQFNKHIRPNLTTAKRGYESKIPLYKIFNYILYRVDTGCQWKQLPIEKKADAQLLTIVASGVKMVASKQYSSRAFTLSKQSWI